MFGLFLWYFLIILRGSHIEDSTNAEKSFLHVLQFSGIVIANAACSANCSKSEVVESIKNDISRSLWSRYHIWRDDLEEQPEEMLSVAKLLRSQRDLNFPTRYIFSSGSLRLCDYCDRIESMNECKHRCEELLGFAWDDVLYEEVPFSPKNSDSGTNVVRNAVVQETEHAVKRSENRTVPIVFVLVGLISILLYFVFG